MNRRQFCCSSLLVCAGKLIMGQQATTTPASECLVPCRAITQGPKFHWFGYYDKLQFDPTDRYVLSNQVDFEHRSPAHDDEIEVGMIDLQHDQRWTTLGASRAWCWQQGCMLQWRPQTNDEVLWNDRAEGHFVCRVCNVKTGQLRTISKPVYTVSPHGRWGLSVDFARINNMRPGYGYAGVADPHLHNKAPEDSGIWRVDLDTGQSRLIVSLAEIAAIDHHGKSLRDFWNYFNHLLVSPDGSRLIFLHRWREDYDPLARRGSGFHTRMFTCDSDGNDRFILDPSGHTSHFIWRDPQHVCAWSRPEGRQSGFYLFRDKTRHVQPVGQGTLQHNGHNTYVPGTDNQWILCDTYPQGKQRFQIPYLFHVASDRKVELGRFHLPPSYRGEWRCDTHPRTSNNGRLVAIDSPHGGSGRQQWLLDIGQVIDN